MTAIAEFDLLAFDRAKALRLAGRVIRDVCEPPSWPTVTQWADGFRILPRSSTAPGPFRSSVAPYTRRWMDLGADPTVTMMAMCWSSQSLKSTVLENILGHRICTAPAPMLFVRPTQTDGEMWAKVRFVGMVRDTPALRERVMLEQSSGSTLRFKKFRGEVGYLWVPASTSATELASWSCEVVIFDETDRMKDIPGEGNPIEIGLNRMNAADVGKAILSSTPGDADSSEIWPALLAGTHEKYFVRCPHCGLAQPLTWRRPDANAKDGREQYCLQWPAGKPEGAVYVCLNGCVIEHRAKAAMLQAEHGAEWVATNPEGLYPSSHLPALYSPFAKSSWGTLAAKWEKAQGKPARLQVFINTILAEVFVDVDVRHDADLMGRREQWGDDLEDRVVPIGVGLLTCGVDVQANRLEMWVWGWGAGLESWLIDRIVIDGDPAVHVDTADGVYADLTKALGRTYRHVNGHEVPIRAGLMDSGFGATQIYRFCNPRRKKPVRKFFACKGDDGDRPLLGNPTLQSSQRVPLYLVGTDTAKNEFLRSQVLERDRGPGYVNLPLWMTEEECLQLVSEERKRVTQRTARGIVTKGVYVRKKFEKDAHGREGDIPNEGLDARNYARAAVELVDNYDSVIARGIATYAKPIEGAAPQHEQEEHMERPRPPARPRHPGRPGGWMGGFR